MAFKTAASLAYKAGMPQASPVLLEPIGNLKVYVPDSNTGDMIGELNKRRGRVLGMNPADDGLQDDRGRGPDERDGRFRHRAAFHHAGPRLLHPHLRARMSCSRPSSKPPVIEEAKKMNEED